MKLSNILILIFLTSCATRKKTIVYSAIASSVAGSLIGKAVSPNEDSNAVNMAGGMIVGAIVGGVYGDSVYKDRHPDVDMKEIPINNQYHKVEGEVQLKHLGIPMYVPEIADSTEKEYLKVEGGHSKIAQRQYMIEHQVEKRSITTPDGKKFIYPAMKIIEVGIENE